MFPVPLNYRSCEKFRVWEMRCPSARQRVEHVTWVQKPVVRAVPKTYNYCACDLQNSVIVCFKRDLIAKLILSNVGVSQLQT